MGGAPPLRDYAVSGPAQEPDTSVTVLTRFLLNFVKLARPSLRTVELIF